MFIAQRTNATTRSKSASLFGATCASSLSTVKGTDDRRLTDATFTRRRYTTIDFG